MTFDEWLAAYTKKMSCQAISLKRDMSACWHDARREMRDEIIAKLAEYEADKCAQIAASVRVGDEPQ